MILFLGPIPSALAALTNLRVLDLDENTLTGIFTLLSIGKLVPIS